MSVGESGLICKKTKESEHNPSFRCFLCKFAASARLGANPKAGLDSSLVPVPWTKWDEIDNKNLTWRGKRYLLLLICTCWTKAEHVSRIAFYLYNPSFLIPKQWGYSFNLWHKLMQVNCSCTYWFCFSLGRLFSGQALANLILWTHHLSNPTLTWILGTELSC